MSLMAAVPEMHADVMTTDTLTTTEEATNTVATVDNMSADTATKDMSETMNVEPVPQKEPEQTSFDCEETDTKLSVTNEIRTKTEELANLKKKLVEVKKRDAYLKKHAPTGIKPARGVKKEKKVRAPGTKRRVLSPYICFVKSLSGSERPPLAEIGAKWKAMSDEDKAPFVALSKEDDVLAEAEAAKERETATPTTAE
ncbi:hypothetical protein EhV156_00280 [Emiliania huxleyi virus 156]|nr:hypothetical protein EhV156_00280 [Emiliania huxleyi virus 156]